MCGITGFWGHVAPDRSLVEHMAYHIETRRPNESGHWADYNAGLALATLDCSPSRHQPVVSPCRRYVLVFNGKIYNHHDLRVELAAENGAFDWRSQSDTETFLAGLHHWGLEHCLKKLNGIFSFALWDALERTLFLARDRMGAKPLYYGCNNSTFLFGSELKALAAHPNWHGKVDRDALALYLRHNYVPAPWSIYQGIAKLPPAHFVVIREGGRAIGEPQCYWSLGTIAEQGIAAASGNAESLSDELDALLHEAIGRRMATNVPLGAFLSGGYDSTMVAAVMQAQSERPIQTFTIGFFEEGYNEAVHAQAVANHLGTDHTELYVTPEQAIAVIPQLPTIYDEPFSDSSQIPTYLVSQLAKRHVAISLSGDGGDELFYGYSRYFKTEQVWGKLGRLPLPMRKLAATLIARSPGRALEKVMQLLPSQYRINHLADRLPRLAKILNHPSGDALYHELVSHAKNPEQLVLGAMEPDTIMNRPEHLPDLPGLRERMMYLDQMTYLPDDILTKVDRASMAVGLETRMPLLDHQLVEFAWRVPTKYKVRDGQGKWLLRQVLYRYVPQKIMDRPKMGFGIPIEHWLRGPLREWAEELLDEKRLREESFFDPAPIRKMWDEHVTDKRSWHYYLWDVLMFQAWLEKWHGR